MILSAQTGKKITPEKLFKRRRKKEIDEKETQRALELLKKKREELKNAKNRN